MADNGAVQAREVKMPPALIGARASDGVTVGKG